MHAREDKERPFVPQRIAVLTLSHTPVTRVATPPGRPD